jgi:hypothetical protein
MRSVVILAVVTLTAIAIGRAAPAVAVRSLQGAFESVPTTGATVVVNEGDCLWVIARRTLPSRDPRSVVTDLRVLNHLSSNLIHPGQVLLIPGS